MAEEITRQADNVRPPRAGKIWAQAVDTTSRAYLLTGLAFGDETYSASRSTNVYLTIQAEGGDIYLAFDSVGTKTLVAGTVVAAGGTPAFADSSCFMIPNGQERSYRIVRNVDKYLLLIAGGSYKARICASSDMGSNAQG